MSRRSKDVEPTLRAVQALLREFVAACQSDPWGEVIAEQAERVIGVTGPYWDATLIIDGDPDPVPAGTPIPLNRVLETRPGVEPAGSVLLWIDRRTGVINSLEFAVYEPETVDRYPAPADLMEWVEGQ